VTHTIADAEAAIARNPQSLEELSRAADLLIEHGDPRGEDFSLCLQGGLTADELMRRHPACRCAMFVAAWSMEGKVFRCKKCSGSGRAYIYTGHGDCQEGDCWACLDGIETGFDFAARAEALRLLAECGKVGMTREADWIADVGGYFPETSQSYAAGSVATIWYEGMRRLAGSNCHAVRERFALLDAYADADPETRRRWADETRALTPLEVVPIKMSAADSEFLDAIHNAETAARAEILRGAAVPDDVLRGGSYIDTPGDGR